MSEFWWFLAAYALVAALSGAIGYWMGREYGTLSPRAHLSILRDGGLHVWTKP